MTRRKPAARRAPAPLGTAEQLPSGRWRASYRKDGRKFTAPHTFATRDEAHSWLATERADRSRGLWRDPLAGAITLEQYARTWLDSRPDLGARTVDSYRRSLHRWVLPRIGGDGRDGIELGSVNVGDLTPALVRAWYSVLYTEAQQSARQRYDREGSREEHPARRWARARGMAVAPTGRLSPEVLKAWNAAGTPVPPLPKRTYTGGPANAGRTAAAHAYRLLRTICNTAVQDELLKSNPCQIAKAGSGQHRERTTATPAEVAQLAALMPRNLAAAVTLAAWSGLRYGELFALSRRHVDLEAGTLRVDRALQCVPGQPIVFGKPKTTKSNRVVHLPAFAMAALADHLEAHVPEDREALLFTLPDGNPVTSTYLSRHFRQARAVIDRDDLTWHDLRHTGATLAYRAGASLPEVQARLGHTTMRAAAIYAHAADDSDRVLAERLDAMFSTASTGAPKLRAV